MKAIAFLANGFETVEALAVIDILRRAGVDTQTVSVTDKVQVESAQKIQVMADKAFSEDVFTDADLLFLPGGPGHVEYEKNSVLIQQLQKACANGTYIAAICAAPSVLGRIGMLQGKRATCFPGYEQELKGAVIADKTERVVVDGNVITSRGMGTSIDLGLELVALLKGREEADRLSETTQYK